MWINTHKTLRDWSALDVLFISSGQLAVQVILVLQNRGLVVGMTGDVAKFSRNSRYRSRAQGKSPKYPRLENDTNLDHPTSLRKQPEYLYTIPSKPLELP